MRAVGGFLVLVLGVLAACVPQGSEAVTLEAVTSTTAGGPLGSHDLRLTTAHAGLRRFEFVQADGLALAYREEIVTDGEGRYSIRPVDGDAALDWSTFELLQVLREGFLFRYRDLAVRHAGLLARNWEVTPLGPVQVAGRGCRALRLRRTVGEPIVYELAIDQATELVLESRRYDGAGQLVVSMRYENFRSAPDLSGVAWHVPANDEQALLPRDLALQLGQPVLEPRLLPEGFALYEAATVSPDGQKRWLKLTYTDGLEPLFFLEELVDSELSPLDRRVEGGHEQPVRSSRVTLYSIQNLAVAQGRFDGHEAIAMGAVPEVELLDLIESALP